MAAKETAEPYLEYLKIEMTIMAVLSAFCVAVPALIVQGAPDALTMLWEKTPDNLTAAFAGMLLAALLFYRQRSHLAWYFGQVSLMQSKMSVQTQEIDRLLDEADYWDTWICYKTAFVAVSFVAFEALCIYLTVRLSSNSMPGPVLTVILPGAVAIIVGGVIWATLRKFRDKERPWHALWAALRGGMRGTRRIRRRNS